MISSSLLKKLALESGFSLAGVARARPLDSRPLDLWLAAGRHASMQWLEETRAVRTDPRLLLPGAKTVLALAACYMTEGHSLDSPVAPYAQGRDYHAVMKDKLRSLRRRLEACGVKVPCFGTCDTVPIHEKAWAVLGGLGWLGKSCLLVTPGHGTRVVLGALILGDEADAFDEPMAPRCGDCTRCLDACPTGALLGDGTLDAEKCLAFQTVENAGRPFPEALRSAARGTVFGCDICQRVCPWNRPKHACGDPKFAPRPLAFRTLDEWAEVSPEDFEAWTRGSALKRAGLSGIRRNARAALGMAEADEGDAERPASVDRPGFSH